VWILAGAKSGGARVLIAAEAVVEDGLGPIEHGEADAFAALGQLRAALLDQIAGVGLVASKGEESNAPYGGKTASDASVAVWISSTSDAAAVSSPRRGGRRRAA